MFSVTPFNNKPESARDFTILIKSSISLFNIISVALCEAKDEVWLWEDEGLPDPKIFLCLPASAADAAAVNLKELKQF